MPGTAKDLTMNASREMPEGAKKALAASRKAEREAVKRAAAAEAKAREYEDRDKTEQQKLTEKAATAEADAAAARAQLLRYEVASEKGLTASQAKRLVGGTKDELLKDADVLLADINPNATNFDGGARKPAETGGMDALIRRQAGRT
jgi:hypothetical protein